jgi:hypothetical protein
LPNCQKPDSGARTSGYVGMQDEHVGTRHGFMRYQCRGIRRRVWK